MESIQGHGRQLRQTDLAGDSPFSSELPCLKQWSRKAEEKRDTRKRRLAASRSPPTLPCPHFPRQFYAMIGLPIHLRGPQRRGDDTVRRNWFLVTNWRRRRDDDDTYQWGKDNEPHSLLGLKWNATSRLFRLKSLNYVKDGANYCYCA